MRRLVRYLKEHMAKWLQRSNIGSKESQEVGVTASEEHENTDFEERFAQLEEKVQWVTNYLEDMKSTLEELKQKSDLASEVTDENAIIDASRSPDNDMNENLEGSIDDDPLNWAFGVTVEGTTATVQKGSVLVRAGKDGLTSGYYYDIPKQNVTASGDTCIVTLKIDKNFPAAINPLTKSGISQCVDDTHYFFVPLVKLKPTDTGHTKYDYADQPYIYHRGIVKVAMDTNLDVY